MTIVKGVWKLDGKVWLSLINLNHSSPSSSQQPPPPPPLCKTAATTAPAPDFILTQDAEPRKYNKGN